MVMKRTGIVSVIAAAILLLLAGCGKNENGSKEQNMGEEKSKIETITASELVSEMKIGWNLGNTMESLNSSAIKKMPAVNWETAWGNPVTSKELIDAVIDKGFNVIRIPVSWNDHILISGNWQIEEGWMNRVQEIVDYAYDQGAYVILNTHHESWYGTYYDKEEHSAEVLAAIWSQIAERFKDYDEHLIFEGLNEPRKIGTDVEWNGGDQEGWDVVNHLNAVFVQTIRESGGNNPYRILMIPGYAANCWEAIKHIEVPDDNKIIVSVHAYEPYDFALNVQGRGTWDQDTANIDTIMSSLDTLFISKGIPVIIGEFGAMYKNVERNEQERAAWAEYYVSAAAKIGVPCIWWDNGAFEGDGELFGLIDRETCEWKYPLVVEGLMKGLQAN
ncbi:MAG: glycoside hydrolase family 5 protein [Bacillota bacterium]|nr:glycoside hydrolase family 5 protein [Bacillota bacterium]